MRSIVAALLALILMGVAVNAQADPAGKAEPVDKFQERLETLITWKMMEALDLDRTTADKVLAIRYKFLAQRKELQKGLAQDYATLKRIVNQDSAVDDKELAQVLADVRDKRKKLRQVWDEQLDEVSTVLSLKQQAQLVLFFNDFRKEFKSLLRKGGPGGGKHMDRNNRPGNHPHSPQRGLQDSSMGLGE
ncbi:MAG TPA: hypothetical protein VK463_06740 [Desulfomonilaceae bacterium]|nr:hypothetical protein [Desulfomonilaceae bacterium]